MITAGPPRNNPCTVVQQCTDCNYAFATADRRLWIARRASWQIFLTLNLSELSFFLAMNSAANSSLVSRIEELSGQRVLDCYQCGCCTAGCPIGELMDPAPSKAIRLLQLGRAEELLASEGIWLCASCLVCGTRCPRNVDYAKIAEACRAIVLRAKRSVVDPDRVSPEQLQDIPQQAFIASFRKFSV